MKDLEGNKIAAAILLAGLLAMFSGKIADALYHPDVTHEKRGFEVEVIADSGTSTAEAKEEVIDVAALMASADVASGEKTFKKCSACHSVEQGGPNKVGPALYGIVNNRQASVDGYSYSSALSEHGKEWNYDELFAFLKKPSKYAPGTKMSFAGLRKPKDIANLVKYLESKGN